MAFLRFFLPQRTLENVRRSGRTWKEVIRHFKNLLNFENAEAQEIAVLSKVGLEVRI